ncbi:MAG: hypothetical protein AAGN35_27240 [Bacteroidota bacterium]
MDDEPQFDPRPLDNYTGEPKHLPHEAWHIHDHRRRRRLPLSDDTGFNSATPGDFRDDEGEEMIPHDPSQETHLPHEAWHVVEKRQRDGGEIWIMQQGGSPEGPSRRTRLPHEAWYVVNEPGKRPRVNRRETHQPE